MANIIHSFNFTALHLSERSSRFAFDTKIKIKVKKDELKEALELLDEWRMIDPEVRIRGWEPDAYFTYSFSKLKLNPQRRSRDSLLSYKH